MIGRQRLFDNDYTALPGLFGAVTVARRSRGVTGLPGAIAIALTAITASLLAGTPAFASSSGSSLGPFGSGDRTPISASPLLPGPLASYDTGKVIVAFPSTLPRVHLYQDANASIGATLDFAQVVEIGSVASGSPPPVAAAFPQTLAGFNGSGTPTSPGSPFVFTATLSVEPVRGSALGPNASLSVAGAPIGVANVRIAYNLTATNPALGGVVVHWSVTGWPWVHPNDLLAVVFTLSNSMNHPFVTCPASMAAAAPCAATPVPVGSIKWNSGLSGVEAPAGNDSEAELGVNTTGSPVPSSAVNDGLYVPTNGTVELLIAAPAGSGGNVGGSMTFALVTNFGPLHLDVLQGVPLAYLGTAAVGAAVAAASVLAYRRRERRVLEEL
ncbi:MAG: hypothetical protein L3J87_01360 [Thermoplasmata archaeon]|nr:hypothetical protein [Thermoplasmata archaeon]